MAWERPTAFVLFQAWKSLNELYWETSFANSVQKRLFFVCTRRMEDKRTFWPTRSSSCSVLVALVRRAAEPAYEPPGSPSLSMLFPLAWPSGLGPSPWFARRSFVLCCSDLTASKLNMAPLWDASSFSHTIPYGLINRRFDTILQIETSKWSHMCGKTPRKTRVWTFYTADRLLVWSCPPTCQRSDVAQSGRRIWILHRGRPHLPRRIKTHKLQSCDADRSFHSDSRHAEGHYSRLLPNHAKQSKKVFFLFLQGRRVQSALTPRYIPESAAFSWTQFRTKEQIVVQFDRVGCGLLDCFPFWRTKFRFARISAKIQNFAWLSRWKCGFPRS